MLMQRLSELLGSDCCQSYYKVLLFRTCATRMLPSPVGGGLASELCLLMEVMWDTLVMPSSSGLLQSSHRVSSHVHSCGCVLCGVFFFSFFFIYLQSLSLSLTPSLSFLALRRSLQSLSLSLSFSLSFSLCRLSLSLSISIYIYIYTYIYLSLCLSSVILLIHLL